VPTSRTRIPDEMPASTRSSRVIGSMTIAWSASRCSSRSECPNTYFVGASPPSDRSAQATLIVVGTRPLAIALVLASVLTLLPLALVARIAVVTGYNSHVFLLWNLMLAWVPLAFALALEWRRRRGRAGVTSLVLGAGWLLFLPNAPYLVTDIVHLGHK